MDCLFGASKLKDNKEMRRGRVLESSVMKAVSKKTNIPFVRSGLFLSGKLPLIGASPDGISDESVLEIKCPYTERNKRNYIDENDALSHKC